MVEVFCCIGMFYCDNMTHMEQFNFPKIEEIILKFWKEKKIFEKSLKARARSKRFVFFDGPPTANGRPGIHHILSRAFKDIFCRYKTMQGFLVERKAGWDTHGLPVELEVEKKMGIQSKPEIEKYGIALFNKKCKQSVWEYKDEWEKITARTAYWVNMKEPYITYDNKYIESLWWIIGEINKKKLLYQGDKIVPYCPRCGTSLSSHEVAQGYKRVKDPSVYVKFEIRNSPNSKLQTPNSNFLVWTTTPWTLPANTALAVGPEIDYVQIRAAKDYDPSQIKKPDFDTADTLILAKSRLNVIKGSYHIEKEFKGRELIGEEYEPIFQTPNSKLQTPNFTVVGADFISTEDGTGIVHIAPAFGEDDMQTAKKNNLSTLLTVDEQGRFKPEIIPWAGMFVKDADPLIIEYLKIKNILYKLEKYEHDYPFCWRCQTPLLYYAKKTWFVGMSQLRDKLIANNNKVNWVPGHLKDGRFGEWLSDVKDWAFSRERYWGTPLPVWICQGCGNKKVISSLEDLSQNQTPRNNYFFMRHAEAENNQKGLIGCWPEPKNFKLTKKGEEQVKKAVLKLKKENKGKIDIIFASDLQRTKDTAQAIAEALGVKRVIYDSRLREVIFGSYNGKSSREYHAFFKTKKDRFERAPHGGESWNEVRERIFEFLRKVDDKMEFKNILIVGHGDPLWLLGGAIKHLGYDKQLKLKYPKTGDVWREKYLPSPVDERGNLDLHRPYIDNIDLTCENCKKTMRRVPDVVDVWFDSGAMPFAQWHFPFENKARINKSGLPVGTGLSYPADFICEGIDQTRGWFYTLLAVATLLGKGIPYKNVISNGHVLDKSGQKMSKSKGNVINPWEVIEKYGSDVIRWYFYTINPVGESKLFDEKDLQDRQRNFVMTIINTLNFYKLYGEKSSKLNVKSLKLKSNNILDKWILARFNMLVEEVTKNLDDYDATTAGRAINNFVDDLSNWYIRRSRRRFRDENSTDYKNAAATIRYILISLSKLIAPFTPFLAEYIFHNLEGHEKSVHLENYPRVDKKLIKRELVGEMALVRKIVALGLKLRAQNQLKVRQPLAKLKVKTKELKLKSDLMELIKDELNIKNVLMVKEIKEADGWRIAEEGGLKVALNTKLNNELRAEGIMRDIVRNIQDMRKDAKLTPNDIVSIDYCGSRGINTIFEQFAKEIKKTVLAKNLLNGCSRENEAFLIKRDFDLDFGNGRKEKVWIGIKN